MVWYGKVRYMPRAIGYCSFVWYFWYGSLACYGTGYGRIWYDWV